MYTFIKNTILKILPKKFLHNYEFHFRKIIAISYKGSNFQCNLCNTKLKRFVILPTKDLLCPACGSRSRTRRLWELIQSEIKPNMAILEFSPPRIVFREMKKIENIHYYATDFVNEFAADYRYDITAISKKDNFFDLIICYHILEHIIEDSKAIKELYRVLKPDCICFVQTPFKEGEIYEDFNINSKEDRLKAFGQEDHVRVYSVKGLKERLVQTGFYVEVLDFKENENHFNGFKSEVVLKLKKQ